MGISNNLKILHVHYRSWKKLSEAWKSAGNLILKKDMNPVNSLPDIYVKKYNNDNDGKEKTNTDTHGFGIKSLECISNFLNI